MKEKLTALKFEYVYALLMLIFGIALVFINPPFQIPDSGAHFSRSYQISEGYFRSPLQKKNTDKDFCFYSDIPESIIELIKNEKTSMNPKEVPSWKHYHSFDFTRKMFSIPLNEEENLKYTSRIRNTGAYSPLVYAPQALFIFLARETFDTVGAVYYSSKIGALLFTIVCIFLAMKLLPEKKLLIFVLAFAPTFLLEISTYSADSVTYSIAILATAYLLHLRKSATPISTKEIFCIALIAVALGLLKYVYGTILLLYFLIPAERFENKRKFFLYGVFFIVIFFVTVLGWIVFAKAGQTVELAASPKADMYAQLAFITSEPLQFVKIFFHTLETHFLIYYKHFIGVIGWLVKFVPNEFFIFYGVVLIFATVVGNINLTIKQRLFMFTAVIPTIFVMFFYTYVLWSPPQNDVITSIQGCYFIPCALMLLIHFSFTKNFKYETLIAFTAGSISGAVTIYTIFDYFY